MWPLSEQREQQPAAVSERRFVWQITCHQELWQDKAQIVKPYHKWHCHIHFAIEQMPFFQKEVNGNAEDIKETQFVPYIQLPGMATLAVFDDSSYPHPSPHPGWNLD